MRLCQLISAIGFLAPFALAGAAGHSSTAGKYTWAPPRDVVSFYKRHRLPAPTAVLWLNEKGVFRHVLTDDQGSETTVGTFAVEDDRVTFKIESGDGVGLPRTMLLDDSGISAGATCFLRAGVKTPVITAVVRETPVVRAPSWIVGAWTLRGDGGEDTGTRFSFSSDGSFRYKGLGGTSAGKFTLTDTCIEIQYTEVDGVPVEHGVHMHKSLPIRDENSAFIVDTYRYEKASSGR